VLIVVAESSIRAKRSAVLRDFWRAGQSQHPDMSCRK
jgi:hypothetical protein